MLEFQNFNCLFIETHSGKLRTLSEKGVAKRDKAFRNGRRAIRDATKLKWAEAGVEHAICLRRLDRAAIGIWRGVSRMDYISIVKSKESLAEKTRDRNAEARLGAGHRKAGRIRLAELCERRVELLQEEPVPKTQLYKHYQNILSGLNHYGNVILLLPVMFVSREIIAKES